MMEMKNYKFYLFIVKPNWTQLYHQKRQKKANIFQITLSVHVGNLILTEVGRATLKTLLVAH